jgi:hypothetical protein
VYRRDDQKCAVISRGLHTKIQIFLMIWVRDCLTLWDAAAARSPAFLHRYTTPTGALLSCPLSLSSLRSYLTIEHTRTSKSKLLISGNKLLAVLCVNCLSVIHNQLIVYSAVRSKLIALRSSSNQPTPLFRIKNN